jgi:hypothetical protein
MWPDWLSDARTLRAKTRWPLPLCNWFVSRLDRYYMKRDIALWTVVSIGAFLGWRFVVDAILAGTPISWDLVLGSLLDLSLLVILLAMCFSLRRARLYRVLQRFRAAPWCPECRYPVAATLPGRAICPECGEPIAPEIAALAGGPGARAGSGPDP